MRNISWSIEISTKFLFFLHNQIFFYCKIIRFFSFQNIYLYKKKKKLKFFLICLLRHRGGGRGASGHVCQECNFFWTAPLMHYWWWAHISQKVGPLHLHLCKMPPSIKYLPPSLPIGRDSETTSNQNKRHSRKLFNFILIIRIWVWNK